MRQTFCSTCIREGRGQLGHHFCPQCDRFYCDAHVTSDPHYVPPVVDDRTLDLFEAAKP